jgi:hypothetical protein
LSYYNAVNERVKSDRASRVHADQVSLDRGIIRTVEAHAADRDAVSYRVNHVAGARYAAANCHSGAFIDLDSGSRRADRCRSCGIGADIIALHQRRVTAVQDQSESTIGRDYVACAGRGATDDAAGCERAAVPHLNGRAVTHHRFAISIHANEIARHNIVVAAQKDQCLVCVSDAREAESLDSGTGTIAGESAYCGRTQLYHAIASGIANDLDQNDSVIADGKRVRACARLRVAIDDHRLTESETEAPG